MFRADRATSADYAVSPFVKGADGLFLVTEWNDFRNVDLERVKKLMKGSVIFDGRNVFDPALVRETGFQYYGVGRR